MASQLVTSAFWHTTFDDIFKDFSPDEWTLEPTDRPMPKDWGQYKDSAKVKFICGDCDRSWTSMNGRVIFWYKKIDEKEEKKESKTEEGKCTSNEGNNDEPKKTDKCKTFIFRQNKISSMSFKNSSYRPDTPRQGYFERSTRI